MKLAQIKSLPTDKNVSLEQLRAAKLASMDRKLFNALGKPCNSFMASNGLKLNSGLPITHFFVYTTDITEKAQELGVKVFHYKKTTNGHKNDYWAIPFNRLVCPEADHISGLKNMFAHEFFPA